jgi:hypothetical protein
MDSTAYVFEFLKALGLTLLLEVPVLILAVRKGFKVSPLKLSTKKLVFTGLLASITTLPYLWFVLPHFIENYSTFLMVGEVSVTLIEAALYAINFDFSLKKAALLAFLCNLISFSLGLLLPW